MEIQQTTPIYSEKLSKNQSLRKELGVNAKNRIIEKFSPEIIAKKFVKIYSELFSENQSSKDWYNS